VPGLDVHTLLRPGLLDGVAIAVAGPPAREGADRSSAGDLAAACSGLGARVARWELPSAPDAERQEAAALAALEAVLDELGGLRTLIVDGAALFGESGDRAPLVACLESCWNASRAAANRVFLPDGDGGRIVLLAPAADAGEHCAPAVAGIENLARTLSIEWARHRVTTVALAPGTAASAPRDTAAVAAYLASPAGAYFSGCLLDMRGPR
jgi:NAD(P)-dependent dehydrogenase (short-subunit alcohol dehydrogenase family)